MTPAENLMAARDLISDPKHWTTRTEARTINGEITSPTAYNAFSFCAYGAINRILDLGIALRLRHLPAQRGSIRVQEKEKAYLKRAASLLYDETRVSFVNDNLGHSTIMDVYDEAIRLAKEDE